MHWPCYAKPTCYNIYKHCQPFFTWQPCMCREGRGQVKRSILLFIHAVVCNWLTTLQLERDHAIRFEHVCMYVYTCMGIIGMYICTHVQPGIIVNQHLQLHAVNPSLDLQHWILSVNMILHESCRYSAPILPSYVYRHLYLIVHTHIFVKLNVNYNIRTNV